VTDPGSTRDLPAALREDPPGSRPTAGHVHLDLVCRRVLVLTRLLDEQGRSGAPAHPGEDTPPALHELAWLDRQLEELLTGPPAVRPPLDELIMRHGLLPDEIAILQLALAWSLFPEAAALAAGPGTGTALTVATCLGRLFPRPGARLAARRLLRPEAPLIASGLLELTAPAGEEEPGAGADQQHLRLAVAPQVLLELLGEPGLPAWIADVGDLSRGGPTLAELVLDPETRDRLELLAAAWGEPAPPGGHLAVLRGQPGSGRRTLVGALANTLQRPVLRVRAELLLPTLEPTRWTSRIRRAGTLARYHGALLHLEDADTLLASGSARVAMLLELLTRSAVPTVATVQGGQELDPRVQGRAFFVLTLAEPTVRERRQLWKRALAATAARPTEPRLALTDIDVLARQFRMNGGQIQQVVTAARAVTRPRGEDAGPPGLDTLLRVGRQLVPAQLEQYSVRVPAALTLADLVLPEEQLGQLREILAAWTNRGRVLESWGFGRRMTTGHGITVLFDGEPGTGKTLTAGILAAELGLPFYRVNVSQVLDKYVGETEKHIERIFQAAHASQALLLFDEADALFTKRVQVDSSMDRFANLQTNTLLQEIENYDGIAILTTNLEGNIDAAFMRRIQYKVTFPFPDADHRAEIWSRLLPPEAPVDEDLDFDELGASFDLAGGYIRNALLRAAYRACSQGAGLTMRLLEAVAEDECRGAGRLFRAREEE